MSFNMFSNKQSDDMDPNYIYPMPYIDPMMYSNAYLGNGSNNPEYQMDPNMTMGGYMTYMNPYMYNPVMGQKQMEDDEFDFDDMEDEMIMQNQMPGMPMMPQGMQGMMPMMPGMMMPPGMMMQCMPGMQNMMNNGMMPMMPPGMMYPYMMMPGMPQINMEEFDEEEM
ncbi:hypothetical protein QOZ84_12165 [Romboutsia sedimentorum]|uniref:Spore coat protein n=1 Tax=Romboutsia sedimentorum TaxID=1368474 RepID=A0ABT7EC80_9FIRM|nr:hypothetical protein [Romboutsia sedimentorum]MDK2564307.1 hypothetical protein [Romboutsia sedimentorum]